MTRSSFCSIPLVTLLMSSMPTGVVFAQDHGSTTSKVLFDQADKMLNTINDDQSNNQAQSLQQIATMKSTLQPLLAKHSGLAYLKLAQGYDKLKQPLLENVVKYGLHAAEYGYPELGYQMVAKAYGQYGTTDALYTSSCYRNLASITPNQNYISECIVHSANFQVMSNKGMQTCYEAHQKAAAIYSNLCQHKLTYAFNSRIDQATINVFTALACDGDHANNDKAITDSKGNQKLKKNDIVMVDKKLYVNSNNHVLIPFKGELSAGMLVQVKQTEYVTYLYNGSELEIAKNDTFVRINGQSFYYENGKLVADRQSQTNAQVSKKDTNDKKGQTTSKEKMSTTTTKSTQQVSDKQNQKNQSPIQRGS
ncbi:MULTISPECIES: hypothetical protein [Cysteiniphilum]|nr:MULTISPECIES: hypothetical protein [Cysteiniphilum]